MTERTKTRREFPLDDPATSTALLDHFKQLQQTLNEPWGGQARIITAIRAEHAKYQAQLEGGADFGAIFRERESEAWYLRMIVMEADIAERSVAERRPWQAVASALKIGELLTEIRMKLAWEPAALTGQKQRHVLAERRDRANLARHLAGTASHRLWQAEAERIWATNPHLSKEATAIAVVRNLGLKAAVNTVRQVLKKADDA